MRAFVIAALLSAALARTWAAPAELSVRVTYDGAGVPGARVTVSQGDRQSAITTDVDGLARLAALNDGVWELRVEMRGFAVARREVRVPQPNDAAPVVVALTMLSFD